ncbi:MAG: class I SAM-dependent methyltransferase [bacterium]
MTHTMTIRDLAGTEFWNAVWTVRAPRRLNRRNFYHDRYARTFARLVKPTSRILEAGCGGSIWLPYLAGVLGAETWGIDYSEVGVEVAKANMRARKARGRIILDDLFTTTALPAASFDLVFSFGLVEHFDDPVGVATRLGTFLAPGGRMLTSVPNLFGGVGLLHRVADPLVYRAHLRLDPAQLDAIHVRAGLAVLEPAAYFGVFSLGVANFERVRRRLPRFLDRILWYGIRATQQIVLVPFRTLHWYPESSVFSPYIQGLYVKPGAP